MGIPRLSLNDPGSYSNPDEIIVSHMDIHLDVDFVHKIFSGYVILTAYVKSKTAQQLVLDSRSLHIKRITLNQNETDELLFTVDEPVHTFGSKLTIQLPKLTSEKLLLKIEYQTDVSSTALQWLVPEQTAGGKYPYVFSQCQPDHCRSIIPCQDTPGVKGTYNATITVPEDFTVLMSAVSSREPKVEKQGKKSFHFNQSVPIPAYLVAIAVGNLESRKIGPRSKVWSEPEIITKAEYEFAETDLFLKTAEDICGPYVWKIYDMLVLPPSFPFGGMENPCLTFITPTLLAGDRSLVSVVAHEIAHSWTGNLVSIKNFEHFWLNEGFTTFIERKINGRVKGEAYRHFSAIGGLKDLQQSVETLGKDNPLTKLVVDLTGVDPDDAFSTAPYEKGHTFLFYLEQLLGGAEKFEQFLRSYFNKFKNQSVDTDDFKTHLQSYFVGEEKIKEIDWNAWLHTPGMPHIIPKYDTSLQEPCKLLANRWIDWKESETHTFGSEDLKSFMPEQVEEFVALLLQKTPIPVSKLLLMENLYQMNSYKNNEIRFRWLRICIQSHWREPVESALKFATEQGRMKYVRPIFRDLFSWKETREEAIEKFNANKSKMMHVLVHNLNNDIKNTAEKST
ncbi:hypothetical protein V9T40_008109 [Parthenolecanium corni]|uniref:Leukotriene A(4) hydrolase n=1 Tax=Parthenolecanium corni TaxID=536013 RepID=A0AAN9TNV7_9HEMI